MAKKKKDGGKRTKTHGHPFVAIHARVFCQATEDEEKVLEALTRILGEVEVSQTTVEGYFGNPIKILSVDTTDRDVLKKMADVVSAHGKEFLGELETRLDEDRIFHFRVSKQAAYEGEIEIVRGTAPGGVIDIGLKVEAYPGRWEIGLRNLREWLAARTTAENDTNSHQP